MGFFTFIIVFFTIFAEAAEKTTIKSDKIHKEQDNVVAIGNVEMQRENKTLTADAVEYTTQTKQISANSLVRIYDKETNSIFFSDSAIIQDDFSNSQFQNGIVVLSNGTVIRSPIVRKESNKYTMSSAKYAACPTNLFKEDLKQEEVKENDRISVSGTKIAIDMDEQRISVKNGIVWLYKIPIFYIPYISTSLSSDAERSGFDNPGYEKSRNYGLAAYIPYNIIGKEQKLIITPKIFQRGNFLTNFTYRNSNMSLTADTTFDNGRSKEIETYNGITEKERKYRGFIDSNGFYDFKSNWYFTYNTRVVSDRDYLRDYHNEPIDYAQSSVRFENTDLNNYNNFNYFRIDNLFYQELTQWVQVGYNTPKYIPTMDLNLESEFLRLYANTATLIRHNQDIYNRISASPSVKLTRDTKIGLIRTDLNLTASAYNNTSIAMPQFNFEWSKSIVLGSKTLIKPIVKYSYSPKVNTDSIANEDVETHDLSFANIFMDNRLIGYDRMEYGHRVSYGFEGILFDNITFGVAQGYSDSIKEQKQLYGFENDLSNYVGYAAVRINDNFDLYYRFMTNKDDFAFERQEATLNMRYGVLDTYITYINERMSGRQQLVATGTLDLTKSVRIIADITTDLQYKQIIKSNVGMRYDDGCVIWTMLYTENRPLDSINKNYNFGIGVNIKAF